MYGPPRPGIIRGSAAYQRNRDTKGLRSFGFKYNVSSIKEIRNQKRLLDKEDKNYRNNLKQLNTALKENQAQLDVNRAKQQELRAQVGVTARRSSLCVDRSV